MPITPSGGGFDFGPLIGPGFNLLGDVLGGIFGGDDSQKDALKFAKKQFKYQQWLVNNRIWATVEDAKRAGIHPLVALGSGASGGWASPVPYDGGGGPGWGSSVGAGLGALGDSLSALYENDTDLADRRAARAEESRQRGLDRLAAKQVPARSTLDKLNEDYVREQIFETRSRTLLNQAQARAVGAETGQTLAGPGAGAPHVFKTPLNTGTDLTAGRGTDAQDWENRYGQIVGEAAGLGNAAMDTYDMVKRKVRKWWESHRPRTSKTDFSWWPSISLY